MLKTRAKYNFAPTGVSAMGYVGVEFYSTRVIAIHTMPDSPIAYAVGLLKGETSFSQMMMEEDRED